MSRREKVEELVGNGRLRLTMRAKNKQGNQYEVDLKKQLNRVILVEAGSADEARQKVADQLEAEAVQPDNAPITR